MGLNYLSDQVKKSTKRRDRSKQEEGTPKLFSRSDIIDVVYDGKPMDGECFEEGERLLARVADEGKGIDLIRCNRRIGKFSEGDDTAKLHTELRNPENGSMVRVEIANVSTLSGGADVRIVRE
jgi:hypothetical protein